MMHSAQPTRIEVIARGIMFHGKHVLLCQNIKHGYFYLPGGHVEPGESALFALSREMREEAGVDVLVGNVVRVEEHLFNQGSKPRHEINVYCSMSTQVAAESIQSVEEHIAFAWVAIDELDQTDVRPGHARDVIRAAMRSPGVSWSSVQNR